MKRKRMQRIAAQGLGIACALSACAADPPTETPPLAILSPSEQDRLPDPPEVVRPSAYVSKVKNLLTGLSPTDAEVSAVSRDPQALHGLIERWTGLPEHRAKMLDFFRNAFQQSKVDLPSLQESLGIPGMLLFNDTAPYNITPLLERAIMDSFAMTVWELLAEQRPLNEALTTQRYMLNPPLMSLMSFLDELSVNDYHLATNRFLLRQPDFSFTLDMLNKGIPIEQTLDPASPNYMRWAHPLTPPPGCAQPVATYKNYQYNYGSADNAVNLFNFLFGKMPTSCSFGNVQQFRPQWTDLDWNDWRMVTIKLADRTQNTSPLFYDVIGFRHAREMTLKVPRVGFFGTLAFHANWPTNATNLGRVTANQALIVALGKSFDGSSATVPLTESTLDPTHATPGSACYGCHQSLDPFRQFFRQSYSLYYHDQTDASQLKQQAAVAIDGVQEAGQGVGDLARILSTHPRFAVAWTQKLCHWANSAPCAEDDPEFLRIVTAFRRSGYKWQTLVHELFGSPLVTLARNTHTYDTQGVTNSIARRDHFCVALSNRLGIPDVCAMATPPSPWQATIQRYAAFIPVDGYDRGFESASLPTDPSAFFRVGTEAICLSLATQVVDAGGVSRYSSTRAAEGMDDLVTTIMAILPSDPRFGDARRILQEHFDAARSSGASATDALKSTFTLACASPSSVIMGL